MSQEERQPAGGLNGLDKEEPMPPPPPPKRPQGESKKDENVVNKAREVFDKMVAMWKPDKIWNQPPRRRTGF